MKSCSTCVFYEKPTTGSYCGSCEYPVPEYLQITVGRYISMPEYSGSKCPTHKSRESLIIAINENSC